MTPAVEGNSWTSYVQGTPAFTKQTLIDGTSATVAETGSIAESSPPMEGVQEFRVETSGMSGTAAQTGGGTFMFTLKSGTNQVHGSAFGFLHNEALDTNTWMNDYLAASNPSQAKLYVKPYDRYEDYGFSLGGPIIKDKTFIFGAFEQYRQSNFAVGSYGATVPIAAMLNGDFSALLNTGTQLGVDKGGNPIYQGAIINPATGLVFPGNIIPQSMISPTSAKIASLYQQNYQPVLGGLIDNSPTPMGNEPWFHQTQFDTKVDHNISDRHRLAGSFIYTARPRDLMDQGGVYNPSLPYGGPLAMSRYQNVNARAFRFSDSLNLSPDILNVASVTYNRFVNPSLAYSSSGDWPSKLGFGNTGAGNFPQIRFGSSVNGISESPIGYDSNGAYTQNSFFIDDNLTWIKGRHTINIGGDLNVMQFNNDPHSGMMDFNFGNNQTGAPSQPWASQVGFGFASFLLGEAGSASIHTPIALYGRRKSSYLNISDTFKMNNRTTLSMGLGWAYTWPYHEKYGHWANFNGTATNPVLGVPGVLDFAGNGGGTFETNQDYTNFSPSIGVAYQASNKVVLRGSYSIFFIPIQMNYWGGVPYGFAPGYAGVNEVLATASQAPAFNWTQGYPGTFTPGTLNPNWEQWGMVSTSPDALQAGYVQQWSAGTEFELSTNTRLSVYYMGNKGSRLQSGTLQQNQPSTGAYSQLLQSGNEWNWVSDAASASAAGVPYPYAGFSNYAFMALFPYPQVAQTWGPLYYVGSPLGVSAYNSLQIELTKRTSHGVSADLSYTLSRATGDVGSNFQETWSTGVIQDVSQLGREGQTILPYDMSSVVKGYVSYELPFGSGQRFLKSKGNAVDKLVSGWMVSTILRYNTGSPLSVFSSNYYPNWPTDIYANPVANVSTSRQFVNPGQFNPSNLGAPGNLYFKPQAFTNPAFGQFGTGLAYYGGLRGFGYADEDIGIVKDTYFKERYHFQIRAEFFNAFNRHYFQNPITDISSPDFGYIPGVNGQRVGQVGLRFEW